MTHRNVLAYGLACIICTLSALSAQNAYLVVRGEHIKEATIQLQSFSWGASNPSAVKSPRDAASGLATGRRQHKPIVLVLEYGKATPQLFKHMVTGSSLEQCDIEVYNVDDATGRETLLYRIKVTGAQIATGDVDGDGLSDEARKGTGGGAGKVSLQDFHFSLSYQKIEWLQDNEMLFEEEWK
jgi:type VI secretion system Hcp family effector